MKKKNNNQNKIISAKGIMSRYGLSYQIVNYYTNLGLLPVSAKKGNVRFYNKNIVRKRLKKIKKLTQGGYSLGLIRKKLIGI